jgi:branched-chain amino acid transport system ATP-binding protein
VLRVKNLHVHYGRIHAIRGASLHVRPKEIVALIGGNGAGKSTLLGAVAGLVRATSGEVTLDNRPITGASADRIVRAGIALVPEGRRIFKPMTVEDNLLLGGYHRAREGAAALRADIEEMLALFPVLRERRGQAAGTLSGGEQQMLAIGRALLARPSVLLLDEPSIGLAPKLVREILEHIARLRAERGVTILLVEQNARAALRIADRGYVLETGRMVLEDAAEDLLANREVQRAYLGRERGA